MSPPDKLGEILKQYGDNKLLVAVASAVVGAILTKLLPYVWQFVVKMCSQIGTALGGRHAHRSFEGRYLNWLVIEQRELKLTGVVSTDDAKKPTLEQVFVSLGVDDERGPENEGRNALSLGLRTWDDLQEAIEMHNASSEESFPISLLRSARKAFSRDRHILVASKTGTEEPWITEQAAVQRWAEVHIHFSMEDFLAELQLRRILRGQSKIAILGSPGAGKTTLLQYIALSYARHKAADPRLRNRRVLKERFGHSDWRLPILVRLSSVAPYLLDTTNGKDLSLIDVLPRTLPPDLQNHPGCEGFFKSRLMRGSCLMLLDGLDEVPTDAEFRVVVRAIESLAIAYSENQFVVTSRIAGWRSGIGADFKTHYVQDMTNGQISRFSDIWYASVERNAVVGPLENEGRAARDARERRARQRSDDLKRTLAENIGIRRLRNESDASLNHCPGTS